MLKATEGGFKNIGALDISGAQNILTTNATLTLLQGKEGDFSSIKVKYGTDACDTVTLSDTNPSVIVGWKGNVKSDSANGVTLSYLEKDNAHKVSLNAAKSEVLITGSGSVDVNKYVRTVKLGEIAWNKDDTARTVSVSDLTFDANTGINASALEFTFADAAAKAAMKAGDGMTLLAGATGLTASSDTTAHSQLLDYTINGAALTGTLAGTISRAADAVNYSVSSMTLNSVDLTNWNGTTAALPEGWGWTAAGDLTVDMTAAPTGLNPGDTKDILTATTNYFKDTTITGDSAWQGESALADGSGVGGVVLTGTVTGTGVRKDNTNTKLLYQQSKNKISTITLGETTFTAGGTARALDNTYDALTATITNGLSFSAESQKTMKPGDKMTILDATAAIKNAGNETLPTFTTETYNAKAFTDKVTDKLTLTGTRTDTLTQDTAKTKLTYTVGDNLANTATLAGNVAWTDGGTLYTNPATNGYAFKEAMNVKFDGVNFTATSDPLNKSMTLIKNASGAVNVTCSGTPSVTLDNTNTTLSGSGTLSGARMDGNDLICGFNSNSITLGTVTVKSVGDTADTVTWGRPTQGRITVDTDNMTVPTTMAPGAKKTILTSTKGGNYFSSTLVGGKYAYSYGTTLDDGTGVGGVVLTGKQGVGGVKVDDTNQNQLVYQAYRNTVSEITLGETTFTKNGTARTLANNYDATTATINAAGLTFTADSQKTMNAGDAMTILDATAAIKASGHSLPVFNDKSYTLDYEDIVEDKGLTLKGSHTDTLSQDADRTKLTYTVGARNLTQAILAGDVAWTEGGTHYTNERYQFVADTYSDLSGMNFTATADPLAGATKSMTLIKNAAGLIADGTPSLTLENTNTMLSGTVTGMAEMSGNDLKYTMSGVTLDTVTVKSVGGTALADGWTKKEGGVTVNTENMTAPTGMDPGATRDILTGGTNLFDGAKIEGKYKYTDGTALDDGTGVGGVKLTGRQGAGGVKVGGEDKDKLVFQQYRNTVSGITLGEVTFRAGGTARTLDKTYDATNATTINADNLTFTADSQKTMKAGDTMIILDATNAVKNASNETLPAFAPKTYDAKAFTDEIEGKGLTFTGTHADTLSQDAAKTVLTYTVGAKEVATATLADDIEWIDGGRYYENGGYTFGATTGVDIGGVKFTSAVDPLTGATKSMTLIENAAGVVDGNISGTPSFAVTLNDNILPSTNTTLAATAAGTAAMSGNDLKYTVTGVTLDKVTVNATDFATDAVPAGWTANASGVAVETENMTVPEEMAPDTSIDILTGGAGFFSDDKISGKNKYQAVEFINPSKGDGVTIIGKQDKGVKADDGGRKLVYAGGTKYATTIALGRMEWGKGRTAEADLDFSKVEDIYATDLAFTFADEADKAALSASSRMTLLDKATNLAAGKTVTDANRTQEIAYSTANGAALTGTLSGTASTVAGAVNYDVTSMTLDSVNLANWDGAASGAVPEGWTANASGVSVTGSFTEPTIGLNTSKDILTATDGYFANAQIDEAIRYKESESFTPSASEGVTFSGTQSRGVKTNADKSALVYAAGNKDVKTITLDEMKWQTGRTAATEYDFAGVTTIDASNLSFNFTSAEAVALSKDSKMTLLDKAANLAAGKTVTYADNTQEIYYSTPNGADLTGMLSGTVSTTAGAVNYDAASMTLDSVNLANWDGTASGAVPEGWTANAAGVSVTGSFTAPTIGTDSSVSILTTAADGYFSGAAIADDIAYKAGDYSETEKNIALSGKQSKGVKADGKNLVYSVGKADISAVAIGAVTYEKGAALLDRSGEAYDYSGVTALDTAGLSVTMTDAQARNAQASDSMTLVKANGTLNDIEAVDAGAADEYEYTPTAGMNVTAAVQGSVSATEGSVLYSVTGNNASNLTFETVKWDNTYSRLDSEAVYTTATVNTTGIVLTGADSLDTGAEMLLVDNYGDSIRKTRGDTFKLGDFTGKGHAYYKDGGLYFVVDKGANTEPEPTKGATGETETVDGGTTDKDVTGGEATGDGNATGNKADVTNGATVGGDVTGGKSEGKGESTGNKANVSGGSSVEVGEDGTGGDVIGGKSDGGDTKGNEANVEGSTVEGGVTGGQSDGGNTEGNKANVKGNSNIGTEEGGVTGGRTKEGEAKTNEANVEGSTVNGDVTGGESGKGSVSENKANVTDSEIKPNQKYDDPSADVTGGRTEEGNAAGNEANVAGTKVTGGDVTGGQSEKGSVSGNKANVTASETGGSEVGGSVTGGETKTGSATENETTVTGSEVKGDVTGGSTEGSGTASENKTNVSGSTVGGGVTGGQSKGGSTDKNETSVTAGSKVEGSVVGGASSSGTAEGNTATVNGGSKVGGNVVGGASGTEEAKGGDATNNKAVVDGSDTEITGSVTGAVSNNGSLEGNTATVTNGSKVGGDVNGGVGETGAVTGNTASVSGKSEIKGEVSGGVTGGSGEAKGNKASVEGSKVGTDKAEHGVVGGSSENGKASGNEAVVTGESEITGSVIGASSAAGAVDTNTASVDGSDVTGSVTGGQTGGTGEATSNTATVTGDSTVVGDVIGASVLGTGTSTGNKAVVTGSDVTKDVAGASSTGGEVTGNEASVTGGSVGGSVYGGKTEGENKTADTNGVTLDGGVKVEGSVFGGFSENGAAEGNTVTVQKADIQGYIFGGKSKNTSESDNVFFEDGSALGIIGGGCETAVNNNVELMEGGVKEHVIGGFASETATNNTVTMTGGEVTGSVIGGYGGTTAADNNNVYLSGGTVKGETITSEALGVTIDGGVYGGYSVSGTTQNNNIYLCNDANISAAGLHGGSREAAGNTLSIGCDENGTPVTWTGGNQEVKDISNFETINFTVVPWSKDKAAITITDGAKSDLSATTVNAENVTFTGVKSLSVNDTMTLLDQSKAADDLKATKVAKDYEFTVGSFVEGKGRVSLDENKNVVYNIASLKGSSQTHNTVMGAEAAMTVLSVGNDFILDAKQGLGLQANTGSDGVAVFAKLGGGKMRQETGSHVDVNTWNAILALGHANRKEKSSFEYGAFFEYGSGNYTTENDAAQRGDGSARYTGGGLLAKWTANHGFYVEGSFRAGTVHDDARNLLRDNLNAYSYETDANYLGFSVGVGKEIEVANGNVIDVYGRYFYNRRNGSDFTVNGDGFSLDAVTSSVLHVGARYTMKREKWNFFAGIAYEHEMDGKANGRVNGVAIEGADISGGSFRGELGATMKPSEKSPWSLDLSVAGYAGKKQGVMGGISVTFGF